MSMSFYSFKNNFIYLLLAVLGFCCCMGFSLVAVCGLLIEVASRCGEQTLEHRHNSCGTRAWLLCSM